MGAWSQVLLLPLLMAVVRVMAVRNNGHPSPYGFAADANTVVGDIQSNFSCSGLQYGYYADQSHNCKVFHICMPVTTPTGRIRDAYMFSFFCPNHTRFSQDSRTCIAEEYAYPCKAAHLLYELNSDIGDISKQDKQIQKKTTNPPKATTRISDRKESSVAAIDYDELHDKNSFTLSVSYTGDPQPTKPAFVKTSGFPSTPDVFHDIDDSLGDYDDFILTTPLRPEAPDHRFSLTAHVGSKQPQVTTQKPIIPQRTTSNVRELSPTPNISRGRKLTTPTTTSRGIVSPTSTSNLNQNIVTGDTRNGLNQLEQQQGKLIDDSATLNADINFSENGLTGGTLNAFLPLETESNLAGQNNNRSSFSGTISHGTNNVVKVRNHNQNQHRRPQNESSNVRSNAKKLTAPKLDLDKIGGNFRQIGFKIIDNKGKEKATEDGTESVSALVPNSISSIAVPPVASVLAPPSPPSTSSLVVHLNEQIGNKPTHQNAAHTGENQSGLGSNIPTPDLTKIKGNFRQIGFKIIKHNKKETDNSNKVANLVKTTNTHSGPVASLYGGRTAAPLTNPDIENVQQLTQKNFLVNSQDNKNDGRNLLPPPPEFENTNGNIDVFKTTIPPGINARNRGVRVSVTKKQITTSSTPNPVLTQSNNVVTLSSTTHRSVLTGDNLNKKPGNLQIPGFSNGINRRNGVIIEGNASQHIHAKALEELLNSPGTTTPTVANLHGSSTPDVSSVYPASARDRVKATTTIKRLTTRRPINNIIVKPQHSGLEETDAYLSTVKPLPTASAPVIRGNSRGRGRTGQTISPARNLQEVNKINNFVTLPPNTLSSQGHEVRTAKDLEILLDEDLDAATASLLAGIQPPRQIRNKKESASVEYPGNADANVPVNFINSSVDIFVQGRNLDNHLYGGSTNPRRNIAAIRRMSPVAIELGLVESISADNLIGVIHPDLLPTTTPTRTTTTAKTTTTPRTTAKPIATPTRPTSITTTRKPKATTIRTTRLPQTTTHRPVNDSRGTFKFQPSAYQDFSWLGAAQRQQVSSLLNRSSGTVSVRGRNKISVDDNANAAGNELHDKELTTTQAFPTTQQFTSLTPIPPRQRSYLQVASGQEKAIAGQAIEEYALNETKNTQESGKPVETNLSNKSSIQNEKLNNVDNQLDADQRTSTKKRFSRRRVRNNQVKVRVSAIGSAKASGSLENATSLVENVSNTFKTSFGHENPTNESIIVPGQKEAVIIDENIETRDTPTQTVPTSTPKAISLFESSMLQNNFENDFATETIQADLLHVVKENNAVQTDIRPLVVSSIDSDKSFNSRTSLTNISKPEIKDVSKNDFAQSNIVESTKETSPLTSNTVVPARRRQRVHTNLVAGTPLLTEQHQNVTNSSSPLATVSSRRPIFRSNKLDHGITGTEKSNNPDKNDLKEASTLKEANQPEAHTLHRKALSSLRRTIVKNDTIIEDTVLQQTDDEIKQKEIGVVLSQRQRSHLRQANQQKSDLISNTIQQKPALINNNEQNINKINNKISKNISKPLASPDDGNIRKLRIRSRPRNLVVLGSDIQNTTVNNRTITFSKTFGNENVKGNSRTVVDTITTVSPPADEVTSSIVDTLSEGTSNNRRRNFTRRRLSSRKLIPITVSIHENIKENEVTKPLTKLTSLDTDKVFNGTPINSTSESANVRSTSLPVSTEIPQTIKREISTSTAAFDLPNLFTKSPLKASIAQDGLDRDSFTSGGFGGDPNFSSISNAEEVQTISESQNLRRVALRKKKLVNSIQGSALIKTGESNNLDLNDASKTAGNREEDIKSPAKASVQSRRRLINKVKLLRDEGVGNSFENVIQILRTGTSNATIKSQELNIPDLQPGLKLRVVGTSVKKSVSSSASSSSATSPLSSLSLEQFFSALEKPKSESIELASASRITTLRQPIVEMEFDDELQDSNGQESQLVKTKIIRRKLVRAS